MKKLTERERAEAADRAACKVEVRAGALIHAHACLCDALVAAEHARAKHLVELLQDPIKAAARSVTYADRKAAAARAKVKRFGYHDLMP